MSGSMPPHRVSPYLIQATRRVIRRMTKVSEENSIRPFNCVLHEDAIASFRHLATLRLRLSSPFISTPGANLKDQGNANGVRRTL